MDWLKVEVDTPDKPECLALAALLKVAPAEAFGRCFLAWRWAQAHTVDGVIRGVTAELLDSIAGLPGFAQALAEVGWLRLRFNRLEFPNFCRHMGNGAKARALAGRRKQAERSRRARDAGVTREEKKREEKKKATPLPPEGGAFARFWEAYPSKTGKKAARKSWDRLKPDDALLAVMLDAIARQKTWRRWLEGHVPNPATWLNQGRWEDEPPPQGVPQPKLTPPALQKSHEQIVAEQRVAREKAAAERAQAAPAPPQPLRQLYFRGQPLPAPDQAPAD